MASGSAGSSSHEIPSEILSRSCRQRVHSRGTHSEEKARERKREERIRAKDASISRLLYFTRHCIRIRSIARARSCGAIFKDTSGKSSRIHRHSADRRSSLYAERKRNSEVSVLSEGILSIFPNTRFPNVCSKRHARLKRVAYVMPRDEGSLFSLSRHDNDR